MTTVDMGLIGLAVMGQNLALNIQDHGYSIAVYNRTRSKTQEFLEGPAKGTPMIGALTLKELTSLLKRPRKLLLMVKAGEAVDALIEELLPFLEPGDILIDGGNSYFPDTERRCKNLEAKGILYVGAGVSGGEEGARHGPSIMPGGNPAAWPSIRPILQSISAKVDGVPCCEWVGNGGAGHYVKMVHNGIEYADMQLICEAYSCLKEGLRKSFDEIGEIFDSWNQGPLNSYLIEITGAIMRYKDQDGQPLLEKILDVAGQKGTGKWTVIDSLEEAIPATMIAEAVFARMLSSMREQRLITASLLPGANPTEFATLATDAKSAVDAVHHALYAAKIISYAQGFLLMQKASQTYKWDLNYGGIALIWRGGCIIRSGFLGDIYKAYAENSKLQNLMLAPFFAKALSASQHSFRQTVAAACRGGIPLPCMSSALSFYDGLRSSRLPANLLQAQRDYFGAHTYQRVDAPPDQFFHTNWTGEGGITHSGSYNA